MIGNNYQWLSLCLEWLGWGKPDRGWIELGGGGGAESRPSPPSMAIHALASLGTSGGGRFLFLPFFLKGAEGAS